MTGRRTRSAARRYRVADGVAHRRLEGQTLLLGADAPELLTLNATGAFIWARVARGRDRDTIVRTFQRAFGIPRDVAERDVHAFLLELEDQGLVRRT